LTKDTHALEPREQRFIDEYLKDLNGAAAAVRAGYSARSAKHTASRILGRQRVADAIAIRSKELTEKVGVTQERIIEQLARIAFQDARKFFDDKGNLKPITELDDEAAAALAGFDIEDTLVGKGDDSVTFRARGPSRARELAHEPGPDEWQSDIRSTAMSARRSPEGTALRRGDPHGDRQRPRHRQEQRWSPG
jgi:hypothetical protein